MDVIDFFLNCNLLVEEAFHVARDAAAARRAPLLATLHMTKAIFAEAAVSTGDDRESDLTLIVANLAFTF